MTAPQSMDAVEVVPLADWWWSIGSEWMLEPLGGYDDAVDRILDASDIETVVPWSYGPGPWLVCWPADHDESLAVTLPEPATDWQGTSILGRPYRVAQVTPTSDGIHLRLSANGPLVPCVRRQGVHGWA